MSITIKDTTAHAIICGAVRYYMGRSTGAAHGVAKDIAELIPELSITTKCVLIRDIEKWLNEPLCFKVSWEYDIAPWRDLLEALQQDSEVVA